MKTETGVMLVKDGRAWGTAYEDGHSRDFGWVSLESANIYNPKFCKAPTDVVYSGSPDTAEVLTGKITRARRVTTVELNP